MDSETPIEGTPRVARLLAACEPLRDRPGGYVAPAIPAAIEQAARSSYLHLDPGERLLAIVDPSAGRSPGDGCALTSRRVCWRPAHSDEAPALAAPGSRSLAYPDLDERVHVSGGRGPGLSLGREATLVLPAVDPATAASLVGVLGHLRQIVTDRDTAESTDALASFRVVAAPEPPQPFQPRVIEATLDPAGGRLRPLAAQVVERRRLIVVPLLAFTCIAVFGLMAARGVSAIDPTVPQLIAWGGNVGASVALDGEAWRLVTSMFLHGGFMHLAFNMWVLLQAGPLVERLFGSAGFALLYLASGIGGALASAWANPLVVSVGASGAIFGVFGGLLAFLLVHRESLPVAVFRPMRSSALAFVVYNGIFGFVIPGIDYMAHFGGLATGFLAGLLLSRPWPPLPGRSGLGRQLLGGAALAIGLGLVWLAAVSQIRKDPDVAASSYTEMMDDLSPILDEFDASSRELQDRLQELERNEPDDSRSREALDHLRDRLQDLDRRIARVPVADPELRQIRTAAATIVDRRLAAVEVLRTYLDAPERAELVNGPEGFLARQAQVNDAINAFERRVDVYFRAHGMARRTRPDPAP